MMPLKNYSPDQVIVVFNNVPLIGFASGESIRVERNQDAFRLVPGSHGEHTRVSVRDRSGRVTVTLMGASPSNSILSGFATADEISGLLTGPLMVKNVNSDELTQAARAWVVKKPASARGEEDGTREWVFETNFLAYSVGGAIA